MLGSEKAARCWISSAKLAKQIVVEKKVFLTHSYQQTLAKLQVLVSKLPTASLLSQNISKSHQKVFSMCYSE